MNNKLDQFSATNPNPVLRADENGTVLYSNKAGETLLNEWGVGVGEKLPFNIRDLVQRVLSRNNPEKMGVIVGKRVYLTVFHPLYEEKFVCISGFDINDQNEFKGKVKESEIQEIANLEIAEIIDIPAIQSILDGFYKITHIPIGLNDLKGKVLVGVGWQDICTKFHRVNPEACKHCIESDIELSGSAVPGEFMLYRCKNNMLDIATPVMVGGSQVGIIFSGQFFFDDKPPDYELFRSQARKYGFNEEEYIEALGKVPRFSREYVEICTSYLMKLANMLSQLSLSNIKLAQSLVEHDALMDALKEREKSERVRSNELEAVLDAAPAAVLITHDPHALKITGNRLLYQWLRLPRGVNLSKSAPEGERPGTFKLSKNGMEILSEDLPMRLAASGKELYDYEFDIVHHDGKPRHLLGNARPLYDDQANIRGSVAAFIDITERKKAEEALKKAHDSLEEKVKKRTEELEDAYNSLRESEQSLTEAQKMAHVGNWKWEVAADKAYWSDEMYRIFGRSPEDAAPALNELLNYIHPEDRDYMTNAFKEEPGKDPYIFDFRIILASGEVRSIKMQCETIFDNGTPFLMKGIVQDITENKRSEEKIRSLASIVESSNDAIGTLSLENTFTGWNKGAENVFGYAREEILGKPTSILAPPHLKEETKKQIERIKLGEIIHHYETIRRRKDGSQIDVSITFSPVFDIHGKILSISFVSRDVTERKNIEKKLRESEGKLKALFNLLPVGVSITDNGRNIIEANATLERILGLSRSDLLNGNYKTRKYIRSNGTEMPAEEMPSVIAMREEGSTQSSEIGIIKEDGSTIWTDVSAIALPFSNGQVVITTRDITESKKAEERIKESEEKYRNIVETANEGIIIIDKGGIITFANKRMADMLGYTPEENIGRPIWDFLFEESKAIVQLKLKNRRSGIDDSYELKSRKKDGSILWTLVNSKSLLDKKGEFIGSMSLVTDITRRKEAEQALANYEIVREKEIHHRIKNNLQVVSSLLDLQTYKFRGRNDIKDSEVLDVFRESQSRVTSMALIHEELYKGGLKTINFSEYLERLTDSLSSFYRHENIDISFNKDVVGDLLLDMDTAIPLGVIINELVSNSFRFAFSDRDRGEIRIKLHRVEGEFINVREECECEGPERTNLILTVSDNGMGIPEDLDLENIDSLGLQLVTCQVAQLDGELEVKRNNGTEFTIRFTVIEKKKEDSLTVKNKYGEP